MNKQPRLKKKVKIINSLRNLNKKRNNSLAERKLMPDQKIN